MSGVFFLDWAVMAVSLLNTILLFWLGFTVLLNAERRTLGIWMAGIGVLMGGAFFFSHTAILGVGLDLFTPAANFWWHLGWIPVIISPFAWYVVMLWYTGFWEGQSNLVYRRHRPWFWLISIVSTALVTLFIFANPLPSFWQVTLFNLSASPSILGIPVLLLFYPFFILACIGLALDALLRPGPTVRIMGQLARQRARPWLIAATLVLFLVALLVGLVMLGVVLRSQGMLAWTGDVTTPYTREYTTPYAPAYRIPFLVHSITLADLLISSLIATAVLLTGQAVVSYEVFTGKNLPRSGLQRYWRQAIILAAGYSSAVSLSLTLGFYPIYSLLLSTLLMVLFFALSIWRSYAERDRMIASLRPFVSSQQLYEQLLTPANDVTTEMSQPFTALCENVLGARLAYLIPLGPLSPLFGAPLAFPDANAPSFPKLSEVTAAFTPQTLYQPVEAAEFGGASWVVPLWNERGLCGVLLLGERSDHGLYSQEEIEIARSAGERLMDIQAGAELARRLMALQRQQLTESQVLDRRTRRILHDDVLPRLHAVLLNLSATPQADQSEAVEALTEAHHQISDLLHDLPAATTPEVTRLGLVGALEYVLEGELRGAFDRVNWQIAPEAAQKADHLPTISREVLFYAIRETLRNAARHARPQDSKAPLHLTLTFNYTHGLEILIQDNGIGIAHPGEQADKAAASGGHGLALHSTMLAVIGGALSIESAPGSPTCIRISIPD